MNFIFLQSTSCDPWFTFHRWWTQHIRTLSSLFLVKIYDICDNFFGTCFFIIIGVGFLERYINIKLSKFLDNTLFSEIRKKVFTYTS